MGYSALKLSRVLGGIESNVALAVVFDGGQVAIAVVETAHLKVVVAEAEGLELAVLGGHGRRLGIALRYIKRTKLFHSVFH